MVGSFNSAGSLPPVPSHERQLDLARRAHAGDAAAFEEMLLGNLRLVLHWAQRYQSGGVELEDLIQEGVFGLHRAIEKFDPDAGFHFSTYATWWVRQSLRRAVASYGRTIRIPDSVLDAEIAAEQFGEERTPAPRVTSSLDVSYGDGSGAPLSEAIPSNEPGTDELAELLVRDAALRAAVDRLPQQLAAVLRQRFGLEGKSPATYVELARSCGVSVQTISRWERKALELLRSEQMLEPVG